VVIIVACSGGKKGGRANSSKDFSYDLTEDGKGILIKGYNGKSSRVVIPSKIDGLQVLEIGNAVFDGLSARIGGSSWSDSTIEVSTNENAGITSIFIPDTVKKIGNRAFSNTSITELVFPNDLEVIPKSVASNCKLLTKVVLPKSLKWIYSSAFSGCNNLSELIIPSGLKKVLFVDVEYLPGGTNEKSSSELKTEPDFIELISEEAEDWPWIEGTGYNIYYIRKDPNNYAFSGCGKLPIKIRQTIKGWGYEGDF